MVRREAGTGNSPGRWENKSTTHYSHLPQSGAPPDRPRGIDDLMAVCGAFLPDIPHPSIPRRHFSERHTVGTSALPEASIKHGDACLASAVSRSGLTPSTAPCSRNTGATTARPRRLAADDLGRDVMHASMHLTRSRAPPSTLRADIPYRTAFVGQYPRTLQWGHRPCRLPTCFVDTLQSSLLLVHTLASI